ncbi:MAG: ABC transporter ATP-binding protein [Paracoccaceae bacterium]|jgi:ABC-type sugar transport system ATPase subunit|nr:ABC transporter ATP-binding protein [Pseudomonadota bacterium]MDA0852345.1 ABC transporter ATP-binding protein [Pseudomonadota bacterium]MDA1295863.1 ABC transporter ATP-binding protein [Pseudomonadota bacterium]NCW55866.1 ABC transporter ATP-binding protein [Paracoccaceae bacterium]
MAQVELKNVNKSFGPVHVIKDVDLEINKGEFVVFVGPSGCGKSTLLRLIAGLETLTSGEIVIADRPVMDLPPSERGIAMVFQSYALYPHMTVFHNMAFSLSLQGLPKSEIQERVEVAAKILQMEHLLDRRPAALSGGQRQRVAIGRAIVRNPEVFLFDEPLSNLDAALRHDTRVEIAKLHNQLGATTIYVTHDQVEAMTLADKIVVLKDGVVMQVGAPMDLFNDPGNEFVASFLGSPKMNFFGGKLTGLSESGETAGFEGIGISVDAVRLVSSNKKAGDEARLGIRPQHLRLDDNGQLKGKITLVECLGTETVVELFDSEGKMFRFASPDALSLSVEQEVAFSFDQTKAHLF